MRALTRSPLTAMAAAAAILCSAGAADAACKKMGFLVNDYGKEGPSKDAQDLLDKHIAEWAAQNGIKNYTVGKKDVKCELYIDVILFDEHTCTASANVCWDEPGKEKPAKSAKKKSDEPAAKTAENDEKKSSEKQPAATEEKVAEEKAAETAAEKPAATAIETGAIQSEDAKPAATPAAAPDDAAARAAAAAERAAEAAERAAAAAERAAAASAASNTPAAAPSQLEMPGFGAGKPADVAPVTPVEPKS
jgi:hypothetical protein